MKRKTLVGLSICLMLMILSIAPVSSTMIIKKTSTPISSLGKQGPILETEIQPYIGVFFIDVNVNNVGDQPAHNVTISDTSFEGFVIYNHRDETIDNVLNPGETSHGGIGIFFGWGKFTVTLTITYDEGISDIISANGYAFLIWCFIP
jgi:hypothetical protein